MLIRNAVSSMLKGNVIECVTFSDFHHLYNDSWLRPDSKRLIYFQIKSFGEYYKMRHFDYDWWSKWNKINIVHVLSNIEGFAAFLSNADDKDVERLHPMVRWT